MASFYEYSDVLNSPIEAFYCNSPTFHLPVETHWHYFIEILYVYKGNISITCNEHTYHLKKGSMLLLPPQAMHSIDSDDESPDFYYAVIKFNINRIQLVGNYLPNLNVQLRKIAQLKNPPLLFTEEDFPNLSLADFFNEMVHEVNHRSYGYNSYVYSRLSQLMLLFLRSWYYKNIIFDDEEVLERDEYAFEDVLIYIDLHSHETINVEDLAQMCNMSYSYFAKLFHKQYGQSCKQYIEFIRLSRAENLLLFTDLDLSTIATETGFSDCSHLIRCFRKRYEITPKQYRMKHRAQQTSLTAD